MPVFVDLPFELVACILDTVLKLCHRNHPTSLEPQETLLQLSWLNSRIRAITLSTPNLWTNLYIDHTPRSHWLSELFSARSGLHKLDVTVAYTGETSDNGAQLLELVAPQVARRIRSLKIIGGENIRQSLCSSELLHHLVGPTVQRLSISIPPTIMATSMKKRYWFEYPATWTLQVGRFYNIFPLMNDEPNPHIKELYVSFDGDYNYPPTVRLHRWFKSLFCPSQLRKLVITRWRPRERRIERENDILPITSVSLAELHLIGLPLWLITLVLRRCNLPSLSILGIIGPYNACADEDVGVFNMGIPDANIYLKLGIQILPGVKTLRLDMPCSETDDSHIPATFPEYMIAHLPCLRALDLSGDLSYLVPPMSINILGGALLENLRLELDRSSRIGAAGIASALAARHAAKLPPLRHVYLLEGEKGAFELEGLDGIWTQVHSTGNAQVVRYRETESFS